MALVAHTDHQRAHYAPELRDGFPSPKQLRRAAFGCAALTLLTVGVVVGRASVSTSTAAPAAAASSVTSPALGPARHHNGVGLGFAAGHDGAVAAATEYASVLAGPLSIHPVAYHAAVATLADPSAASTLLGQADSTSAAIDNAYHLGHLADAGTAVSVRAIPLAYHVDTVDSSQATVRIWMETIFGADNAVAPTAIFATGTYGLSRVDGDWRLTSLRSSDGPAPTGFQTLGDGPTPSLSLPEPLRGFSPYRDAPTG